MKFRDAIRKVTVHDIVSRTLQMEKQPYCYDVDHQSSQYQIHIFYQDKYKEIYDFKKSSRADFFVSTILKLAYNCEYDFEEMVEVFDLMSKIHNLLWWDVGYMVKSINDLVKEITGLELESI